MVGDGGYLQTLPDSGCFDAFLKDGWAAQRTATN